MRFADTGIEGFRVVALRDSGLEGTLYEKGDICIIESVTPDMVTIIKDETNRVAIAHCLRKNFYEDWKLI